MKISYNKYKSKGDWPRFARPSFQWENPNIKWRSKKAVLWTAFFMPSITNCFAILSIYLQYKNQASLFLPCRFIELVSLAAPSPNKKTATCVAASSFFGCPTWIRTKTNCTKNSRTTIILSGNPYAILWMECKNRVRNKIFQIFYPYWLDYYEFALTFT